MPEAVKEKALKITEALYRSTDLFSDAEPLKWSLRETALDILSAHSQDFLKLEELVKNISLKLDLAASGTFISKTNFEVIKRAYGELLITLMSFKTGYQNLLDNIVSDKRTESISDTPTLSLTERRESLILALKTKGREGAGVVDLAKALSETGTVVSEKTVQRELLGLVASGAIYQEGEKRWRKYFVKS